MPALSSAFPETRALFEERSCVFLLADLAAIPQEEALAALLPEERAISDSMAIARRHEFAVGRMLAHAALARLSARDAPILRGERGEPLWPEGIVGSIAHTKQKAAALLAARRPDISPPGIDLEHIARGLSDPAWEHILSPSEEQFFSRSAAQALRMIVFSCKESLYKALYPVCGEYFGFHDAGVSQESAALLQARFSDAAQGAQQSGWLTLTLHRALCAFPSGSAFSCHYEIDDEDVLTVLMPK
ncbi:MAG: 4'-phosphopantetheinyl transferase superfamily protein [Spirochaetota bacterium]|nr:4'-phosphopantetheinyl transferase superfamily protein [Spirochaetota bacterium]